MSEEAQEGNEAPGTATEDEELESLLEFIRSNRGFDFTGYKRPSLRRRISKRMETVGVEGFAAYQDFLEANQHEFAELFDTILINVTGFFRDRVAWEHLEREIVPRLLAGKVDAEPIRVWSAGCASGEEAYTVAMVLAEALGAQGFRERVKVYATDADEDALDHARHAVYAAGDLEEVAPELRERYFEQQQGGLAFRTEFRRSVVFGRHDLVRDPPISRVDLLVCRNTLMYFGPPTQSKILANFHFALRDQGYLFLGRSEMLLTRTHLFQPLNLKQRLFMKAPDGAPQPAVRADGEQRQRFGGVQSLRDAGFDSVPIAQLAVDTANRLVLANKASRRLFGLTPQDLGRPLQDLELSYRPIELRSRIEEVYSNRHPIALRDVEWQVGSEMHVFEVHLHPLTAHDGSHLGTAITFADVTRYRRLQDTLEHSKERLETAYEELQSTAEELETTNEELQSTNEELETTNEELQSTNEELETMNEELQSTNEELHTTNDELRVRTEQVQGSNAFLESVLSSLHAGVIVVDPELVILSWNDHAAELWGLSHDEVQARHLLNLDIGLPVDRIAEFVRSMLADQAPVEEDLEAVNRRGRAIPVRVRVTPLRAPDQLLLGAIVQVEERTGSDA